MLQYVSLQRTLLSLRPRFPQRVALPRSGMGVTLSYHHTTEVTPLTLGFGRVRTCSLQTEQMCNASFCGLSVPFAELRVTF